MYWRISRRTNARLELIGYLDNIDEYVVICLKRLCQSLDVKGETMIELKNISFSYNKGFEVLSNINIKINKNETIGIIGANGAGKSTILKLLVGLELNYEGEIIIENLRVEKKNLTEIRKKIGYVFQDSDSQLFMPTIYEDVAFAPKNYGFSKKEVAERTIQALKSVGMEDLKDRQIYKLSGGQKKLASIATILSMKPDILIFDEPSVALDPKNRRKFICNLMIKMYENFKR